MSVHPLKMLDSKDVAKTAVVIATLRSTPQGVAITAPMMNAFVRHPFEFPALLGDDRRCRNNELIIGAVQTTPLHRYINYTQQ